jgi:hypothetical protein
LFNPLPQARLPPTFLAFGYGLNENCLPRSGLPAALKRKLQQRQSINSHLQRVNRPAVSG